jgi:hypothetical protein
MKKLLLTSIAGLVLASGSAFAADLPPAPLYKAPPPPPPAYSWTGCYVDAGGGYGLWNRDHYLQTDEPLAGVPPFSAVTTTTTNGGRGWLGRFGAGCDYQAGSFLGGNIVLGVFGDYDADSLRGTFDEPAIGISSTEKETGAWAVGGRVGYAVTPAMLWYMDGGYTESRFAAQNFGLTISPFTAPGITIASTTYHGWFLGSGTDTALSAFLPSLPSGLFLRSEFRWSSFDGKDDPILALGVPTGLGEHVSTYVETITTSLVYKFNWMGH